MQVMLEALVGFALELLRLWPLIYAKAAKRCWAVTAGMHSVVSRRTKTRTKNKKIWGSMLRTIPC